MQKMDEEMMNETKSVLRTNVGAERDFGMFVVEREAASDRVCDRKCDNV